MIPFWDSASHSHSCLHVEKRFLGEKRYFISVPIDQLILAVDLSITQVAAGRELTRIPRVEGRLVDVIIYRHPVMSSWSPLEGIERQRRIARVGRTVRSKSCGKFCWAYQSLYQRGISTRDD